MNLKIRWIFLFMLLNTVVVFAQKEERQNIRSGNKHYEKNKYAEAEADYRSALEVNSKSVKSYYNLGNSIYRQLKPEKNKQVTDGEKQRMTEAVDSYKAVTTLAENKKVKAMAWHNIGNLFMLTGDYQQSVDAYKNSLLNNPNDHETRYNYILAKELLKKQSNQQQQEQNNNDNQEQQNQQNKNQNQQTQNQQQQQNQNQDQPQERMSKENAEQILNAIKQQEQETQEKRQQGQPQQHRDTPEKDW